MVTALNRGYGAATGGSGGFLLRIGATEPRPKEAGWFLRVRLRLLRLGGLDQGGCRSVVFGFLILLGEAADAAFGIDQLLAAGIERVAAGADFDAEHIALNRRASLEGAPASAVDGNGMVVGMNTGFHESPI